MTGQTIDRQSDRQSHNDLLHEKTQGLKIHLDIDKMLFYRAVIKEYGRLYKC